MEQKEDHGGWAGIRVPWVDFNNDGNRNHGEQAELNLYGEGTLVAIGGDAGAGSDGSNIYGGGRWWSAQGLESEDVEEEVVMQIRLKMG